MGNKKLKAIIALLLFVPAPSIAVILALHMDTGAVGQAAWLFSKFWLYLGPLAWLVLVEKVKITIPKFNKQGLALSCVLGLAMMFIIWLAYYLFAHGNIDIANFKHKLALVGLDNPVNYLLVIIYWIFINSLLEEYVFRYFIFGQSEQIWSVKVAVVMTALFFTLHHTLALAAYIDWWQNLFASLGVFAASIIWSWLYAKYRSIWPGYISHIFADIGVFSIGWVILFC